MVIEAADAADANRRAADLGVDFSDSCDCCGDRWFEVFDSEGRESPEGVEGLTAADDGDIAVVHYSDGTAARFRL